MWNMNMIGPTSTTLNTSNCNSNGRIYFARHFPFLTMAKVIALTMVGQQQQINPPILEVAFRSTANTPTAKLTYQHDHILLPQRQMNPLIEGGDFGLHFTPFIIISIRLPVFLR
mmetsp:Transcript_36353/g.39425  ORF Transcript_36353/g.39425 Transcript_36353/m.39425 type:complete len:114 (+) Transcript_36353:22-363(+)